MISGEKSEPSKTEAGPGNQGIGVGGEGVERLLPDADSGHERRLAPEEEPEPSLPLKVVENILFFFILVAQLILILILLCNREKGSTI